MSLSASQGSKGTFRSESVRIMNTNGRTHKSNAAPTTRVGGGLAGLVRDVMSLAELQLKLLSVDAKEASARIVTPIILLAVGTILALCSIPLGLIAIAQVLHLEAGWHPAVATAVALLIGLVLAGILAFVGYLGLRRCILPMQRSRDELERNIKWLKSALRRYDHRQESVVGQASYHNQPR